MSFKSIQGKIAKKEGVSKAAAGAILAKSSRDASPAAKKANPDLLKVKGARKSGMSEPNQKVREGHDIGMKEHK